MANLTASGSAPQVLWDDTDAGQNDFRVKVNASTMSVEEFVSSSWETHFEISSSAVKSYQDFKVENDAPKLTLVDTSSGSGASEFRMRANGDVFYLEADTSPSSGFTSFLESDGTYLFAPNGIIAGHGTTDGSTRAIGWQVLEIDPLPSDSPAGQYSWTLSGVNKSVVGVIVMVTDDTSSPKTYQVYDSQDADNDGFYVEVELKSTGDVVHLTYDTSTYTEGSASAIGIVFYKM